LAETGARAGTDDAGDSADETVGFDVELEFHRLAAGSRAS
jgi:hypothetical protein